jgi:GMP synthase (glutamine-hydrolysing)
MIIVVDNTKDLENAYMTPKLLNCLEQFGVAHCVVSGECDIPQLLRESTNIEGIILSGGPLLLSQAVKMETVITNLSLLLRRRLPCLGICFGFQLLTLCFGGRVTALGKLCQGVEPVVLVKGSPLFRGFDRLFGVYQCHQDVVSRIPSDFDVIAETLDGKIQAVENREQMIWGVQFHPEGLEATKLLIKNFLDICHCH